jgi:hypothetical protein
VQADQAIGFPGYLQDLHNLNIKSQQRPCLYVKYQVPRSTCRFMLSSDTVLNAIIHLARDNMIPIKTRRSSYHISLVIFCVLMQFFPALCHQTYVLSKSDQTMLGLITHHATTESGNISSQQISCHISQSWWSSSKPSLLWLRAPPGVELRRWRCRTPASAISTR